MKKALACLAIATLLFLIAGCGNTSGYGPHNIQPPRGVDVSAYYFNPWSREFRTLQHDGYVAVFDDKSVTHQGVTLQVEAIVSDGLTTYVRIAVDGELPPGLVANGEEFPHLSDLDDREISELMGDDGLAFELPGEVSVATNHIFEAILSDNSGNEWAFRHQIMHDHADNPFNTLRPTLRDPSLGEKEDVLIFYNTELSGTVTFSFAIEIRGIDEPFIFDDLEVNVAPVVERDLSAYNLYFETEFADVRFLAIQGSYLETIITVEWTIRPEFSDLDTFFDDNMIVFDWGEDMSNTRMFAPNYENFNDGSVEIIQRHPFPWRTAINNEIIVSTAYARNLESIQTMFIIPAVN